MIDAIEVSPAPIEVPKDTVPMASRIAVIAVGVGLFMQSVDSTALSTVLPTLARSFHASPIDMRLVLTIYMVVQALFLPASGWAADRFGARRVFMAAMAVFLLGSLFSGLSHSLLQLIGGRIVQGLGGAMMVPVGRIIVVAATPRNQLIQAMMWLGVTGLTGPIVGPSLGGMIVSVATWPWIFFINLPVGIAALIAIARVVPRISRPHPGLFDLVGFGYVVIVIGAVMTVVEGAGHDPRLQIVAALIAVPAGFAYVAHARRRQFGGRKPVIDLSLLRYPTYRSTIVGSSLIRLGIGGSPYLLALFFQIGLGWPPLKTGIITTAVAVGALGSRPFGPQIVRLLGFRKMLIISSLAIGLFGAAPALFNNTTPIWLMMGVLVLSGYARSSQFSSANVMAYADMPDEKISSAATLLAMMQQLTVSLGITLAGLALEISHYFHDGPLDRLDFGVSFSVIGIMAILAIPIYAQLSADAGADISGQKMPRGAA